jgi:hypothetical protein
MRTFAEIVAEQNALFELMSDSRFRSPDLQMMLARVLNELTWLGDDRAPPVSKILQFRPIERPPDPDEEEAPPSLAPGEPYEYD